MGRGKLVITFKSLETDLGMPEDAEIYGIDMSGDDLGKSQFQVFVKHKDLPLWQEGESLLNVSYSIEQGYDGRGNTMNKFRWML